MRKNIFFSFILVVGGFLLSYSQAVKKDAFSYGDFSNEYIYAHFNSSFLVTGENLLFKVYCLNLNGEAISNISKIAYVELIDEDKNAILKEKIVLNSGVGYGDFFIQTSIPSGNYKIVAYTQWMRNGGESTFFQNDITIVNPFRANKELSTGNKEGLKSATEEDLALTKSKSIQNNFLRLNVNKKSFKKREKVVLTINSLKSDESYGEYSISVKKTDAIKAPAKISSKSYVNRKSSNVTQQNSIRYLPELRGEIISGKVLKKETETGVFNVKVSLSIPGKNPIFKIASTNNSGTFYFNIDSPYKSTGAILQIVGEQKDNYDIQLNTYEQPNYDNYVFNDFELTPELNELIIEKSIANQVENAFGSAKKDSVLPNNSSKASFKHKQKQYILDDYSRFSTLKETITEVVDAVYLTQEKGSNTLNVKFYNNLTVTDVPPLVLVDGVIVQDHNTIFDYDANAIKSVNIIRDKYIYGGQQFMGIISIETLKGDFDLPSANKSIKRHNITQPQTNKIYFNQEYKDDVSLNRIPDFRSQLLWYPSLRLNASQKEISFYTSDIAGEYEICIEGFTNTGEPISIKETIKIID